MKTLELYVHIPFCCKKCEYCDFLSFSCDEKTQFAYANALIREIEFYGPKMKDYFVTTIFIGGGTPTWMDENKMIEILDTIYTYFNVSSDAEITMEANPGTVEADRFVDYQRAGVNRISIGVQSFSEDKLKRLGRIHGPQEAKRAAKLASGLGLRSFNLDLMHGLPDQSLEEALGDLRQAIELNPPHLSWYQLTIEPNTLFGFKIICAAMIFAAFLLISL